MTTSNIKEMMNSDIDKVWEILLNVKNYSKWRSDISKTEVIDDHKFIEYNNEGYATTFITTFIEPYKRWEFDMENNNIKGHWTGIYTYVDKKTQIDFTEDVICKKWFMKPFVKSYLKKQQTQFVLDLKRILK